MAENAKRWRAGGNKPNRSPEYAEQHRQYQRQRYHTDENYRASVKAAAARARQADPEKHAAAMKAWNEANPEKRRANARKGATKFNNSPEGKAYQRAWRDKNIEKIAAQAATYRAAREFGQETGVSTEHIARCWVSQAGRCFYCRIVMQRARKHAPDSASVEHLIPLSRGGTNDPENVVLACRRCNFSKQDRLLSEWQP
jgi:5-methylcytosine-specific restriction endonuclease McrA